VKRIKVSFAGLEVEFADRERALAQIKEFGERGTFPVYVVYGPEGCGKTAFLKQAKAVLEEEFGYHVVYANPLAKRAEEILQYSPSAEAVVKEVLSATPDPWGKMVDVAITIAGWIIKRFRRSRVAVLMDDIFQAVGVENAEAYVKALLNLIEWPPAEYDKVVVLVASSEGVTRERVGRHSWADIFVMWNMAREGFEELYKALPGLKPPFDETWKWTGGNPRYLERLLKRQWDIGQLVKWLITSKGLGDVLPALSRVKLEVLREAVEDPDVILERIREREVQELRDILIEKNLIVRVWDRDQYLWVDTPPPEKDPELGIGKHYAWQTPLHREAVRKALETLRN